VIQGRVVRQALVTLAAAAVVAGCGGSSHRQSDVGRLAVMPCEGCGGWEYQAWRSTQGTTYISELPTRYRCGGGCPAGRRGGGPLLVRGSLVIDLGQGQATGVYRTPKAALFALYRLGDAPDPALLEPALARGELRPAPQWVVEAKRLVRSDPSPASLGFGRNVFGLLRGPVAFWLGRRALGRPLRIVVSSGEQARLIYANASSGSYTVDIWAPGTAPPSPPGHSLRLARDLYAIDITARTGWERKALSRLVRRANVVTTYQARVQ
jgi:hypothetical protein